MTMDALATGAVALGALGALIVSLATLIFTGMSLRQRAHVDRVAELERAVAACEKRDEQKAREISRLKDENFDLMRRLFDVERRANGERNKEGEQK